MTSSEICQCVKDDKNVCTAPLSHTYDCMNVIIISNQKAVIKNINHI